MLGESAIDIGRDAGVEDVITASSQLQVPVSKRFLVSGAYPAAVLVFFAIRFSFRVFDAFFLLAFCESCPLAINPSLE